MPITNSRPRRQAPLADFHPALRLSRPARNPYHDLVSLLDTEQIDAMSAGVPEVLLPIVTDFLSSGRQSLLQLAEALTTQRFADAKGILHQLKGASGTMGMVQLQALCAECEQHVLAQARPPRVAELPALLEASVDAASRYLQGEEPPPEPAN